MSAKICYNSNEVCTVFQTKSGITNRHFSGRIRPANMVYDVQNYNDITSFFIKFKQKRDPHNLALGLKKTHKALEFNWAQDLCPRPVVSNLVAIRHMWQKEM